MLSSPALLEDFKSTQIKLKFLSIFLEVTYGLVPNI